MRVRIRYVYEDLDRHGNLRIYCKPPGRPKTRIREELGSPAFWEVYNALLAGAQPPAPAPPSSSAVAAAPASLRWLVERYYRSGEWQALGDSTRRVRRALYDRICEQDGSKPYRLMEPRHVARIRDRKKDRPEAANGQVKALRQLFAWACLPHVDLASRNPAKEVPYLKGPAGGFHTWTLAEVQAFVRRHPPGTTAFLALALLLMTGVRRSDVVTLGRQMVRPDAAGAAWLHFTEAKGRQRRPKNRSLPLLPQLQAAIEACPSGHLTFLVTEFGKPFTPAGFGNWLRKRCDEAGLDHCSAHGLRKAGATIAALNGATAHQLMAIYGWESLKQAELYTREANRILLAGEAMHLLLPRPTAGANEQDGNRSFPLFQGVSPEWAETAKKSK